MKSARVSGRIFFARQLCSVVRPFVVANHSAHFGATRKLLLTEQHTAPKTSRRYVLAGSLAVSLRGRILSHAAKAAAAWLANKFFTIH